MIGTVLSATFFNGLTAEILHQCNAVEARLDSFELSNLPATLKAITHTVSLGIPVIGTLRLPEDGGHWTHSESDRLPILQAVFDAASTVDIEVNSTLRPALCEQAAALGKPIILSHHDFQATGSFERLNRILEDMLTCPHALPKLAVRTDTETDLHTLLRLVAAHAPTRPLCIMGMGPLGTCTRIAFPALGTKFTYGYLDRTSAPGQKHSAKLLTLLRELCSESY